MSTLEATPVGSAPSHVAAARGGCPITGALDRAGGIGAFSYGLLCYAAFLVTFMYAIGFVGNWFVPKSIDSGVAGALLPSLAVNGALLSIFVVQHTVMARPWFKRRWTKIVPQSIERSTYVLFASVSLMLVFLLWKPLPQTVWQVDQLVARIALITLSLAGWFFVPASSFAIDHFDLFGLRQTWLRLRRREGAPVGFRLVGPYKLVRHPLMLGFLVAFWATPHMSVGHLFFSIMTTAYILFGIWIEERGLVADHGEAYLAYRRRVRGLVPWPKAG